MAFKYQVKNKKTVRRGRYVKHSSPTKKAVRRRLTFVEDEDVCQEEETQAEMHDWLCTLVLVYFAFLLVHILIHLVPHSYTQH